MSCKRYICALAVAVLTGLVGFGYAAGEGAARKGDYASLFSPIPAKAVANPANPITEEKVALGKMLYFDPRLSKSGVFSCNSCHNLASGGVDNMSVSVGHKWQTGARNAPTVLNSGLLTVLFWDGRSNDLEDQAKKPVLNPVEMASTEELVMGRIRSIPEYVERFKKAFAPDKEPLTYDNAGRAIAAFERTLLTRSRFDDYLDGKKDALTAVETKGLDTFVAKGCVGCHNGPALGGNGLQRFDYGDDPGRKKVTGKAEDEKFFRVASLRNVAVTYPYFHDGKVWRLEDAVRIMGQKQLNVKLTDDEVASIVAFLNSLTGKDLKVTLPQLPPSTEATSRPEID